MNGGKTTTANSHDNAPPHEDLPLASGGNLRDEVDAQIARIDDTVLRAGFQRARENRDLALERNAQLLVLRASPPGLRRGGAVGVARRDARRGGARDSVSRRRHDAERICHTERAAVRALGSELRAEPGGRKSARLSEHALESVRVRLVRAEVKGGEHVETDELAETVREEKVERRRERRGAVPRDESGERDAVVRRRCREQRGARDERRAYERAPRGERRARQQQALRNGSGTRERALERARRRRGEERRCERCVHRRRRELRRAVLPHRLHAPARTLALLGAALNRLEVKGAAQAARDVLRVRRDGAVAASVADEGRRAQRLSQREHERRRGEHRLERLLELGRVRRGAPVYGEQREREERGAPAEREREKRDTRGVRSAARPLALPRLVRVRPPRRHIPEPRRIGGVRKHRS
jgi:hypothetical protein